MRARGHACLRVVPGTHRRHEHRSRVGIPRCFGLRRDGRGRVCVAKGFRSLSKDTRNVAVLRLRLQVPACWRLAHERWRGRLARRGRVEGRCRGAYRGAHGSAARGMLMRSGLPGVCAPNGCGTHHCRASYASARRPQALHFFGGALRDAESGRVASRGKCCGPEGMIVCSIRLQCGMGRSGEMKLTSCVMSPNQRARGRERRQRRRAYAIHTDYPVITEAHFYIARSRLARRAQRTHKPISARHPPPPRFRHHMRVRNNVHLVGRRTRARCCSRVRL